MRAIRSFLFWIALFSPTALFAQSSIEICRTLIDGRLIDTSSSSEVLNISRSQFSDFCRSGGSYSSSFSGRSSGFQASFSSFGRSFGLGGGSDSTSGFTQEEFERICDIGASEYAEFVETSQESTSGQFVAREFNECVRTLSRSSEMFLTGTLIDSVTPGQFALNFSFSGGNSGNTEARITAIAADPIDCFVSVDGEEVGVFDGDGFSFSGEAAIICRTAEGATSATGFFNFATGNRSWSIPFSFIDSDFEDSIEDRVSVALQRAFDSRIRSVEEFFSRRGQIVLEGQDGRRVIRVEFQPAFRDIPQVFVSIRSEFGFHDYSVVVEDVSVTGAMISICRHSHRPQDFATVNYCTEMPERLTVDWLAVPR